MLSNQLSAEDQAQLDQMREDDAASDAAPAPTPEQSEETATSEQAETEQPEPEKPPKMVRLEALHEEREERRRLQRELAQEREARSLLDQRTNLILQRMQQQEQDKAKPEEPAIPALEQDPVGHITAQQAALRRQIDQNAAQQRYAEQVLAQNLQAQQIQQAVIQRARSLEGQFRAETPDYDAAIDSLKAARGKELAALGQDPMQAAQAIEQEAYTLAVHAIQNNRNPAELLYSLAKARGWQGNASGQAAPAVQEGASPNPAAAQQKLQTIAAGQRQGRSLSDARGGAAPPLTAQRLLEMSDKDFDKMMQTPEGRALMG